MKAILYAKFEMFEGNQPRQDEVFVMPTSAEAFQHISSPCASYRSPLSTAIMKAIANEKDSFVIQDRRYYILKYRVFLDKFITRLREPTTIDLTQENEPVTIWVYAGKTKCALLKHETIDVKIIVLNFKNNKPIDITNVFYCPMCQKFWLHEVLLGRLRNANKFPKVRYEFFGDKFYNKMGLKPASDLKLYGYDSTVETSSRHALLTQLVYENILTRRDIIDHLAWCIRVPGARRDREHSRLIWRHDINYVHELPVKQRAVIPGVLERYPGVKQLPPVTKTKV